MDLGCLLVPRLDSAEHAAAAEELGYDFAWMADSPAIYADPWMLLARASERTSRIRLGVSVITPRMRHLVANAAAAATLSMMAPGRCELVVGTGFTSQAMIAKPPARWSEVEAYVSALRRLLAGESVEWDGTIVQLAYSRLTGVELPAEMPILVAAHGPKGYAVAERVGDGIVTNPLHGSMNHLRQHERVVVQINGTVLDDGEALDDRRVLEAAGPGAALHLHLGAGGAAGGLDELAGYEERLGDVAESYRHIEMHRGHFIEVTDLERPFVTGRLVARGTDTATRADLHARIEDLASEGVTGVMLAAGGSDVVRELSAFADAVRGRR